MSSASKTDYLTIGTNRFYILISFNLIPETQSTIEDMYVTWGWGHYMTRLG